jgi:hypothetical protein
VENGPSEKNPRGRVTILTLKMPRKLVKDPDFEIPITDDEITKTIFILQSTLVYLAMPRTPHPRAESNTPRANYAGTG